MCLLLLQTSVMQAQPVQYWTVGPKMGYTFGSQGGVTIGAEVSYFPHWEIGPFLPYGFTMDVNVWKEHVSVHVGAETWFVLGVDVGPTLFFSKKSMNLGLSIIGWDGLFLYPYYELGIPFNGELFQGVGGYLKFPFGNYPSFSFG